MFEVVLQGRCRDFGHGNIGCQPFAEIAQISRIRLDRMRRELTFERTKTEKLLNCNAVLHLTFLQLGKQSVQAGQLQRYKQSLTPGAQTFQGYDEWLRLAARAAHNQELFSARPKLLAVDTVEALLKDSFALTKSSPPIRSCLDKTFEVARSYFQMSVADKLRDRLPFDSGYRPLRGEYSKSAEHPDEVESFTASYRTRVSPTASLSPAGAILYGQMLNLFDLLESAAEKVVMALADHTGGVATAKLRSGLHSSSILQLNYSRPDETKVEYINELHEDGCLLTLTSVTGPGLELQMSDGSFKPLAPTRDELLIMSGEILYLLTGGKIQPVFHRVRPIRGSSERISMLFFADLHPTLCEPWVVNGTNSGIDIGAKVLKNATRYGLSEWTLD